MLITGVIFLEISFNIFMLDDVFFSGSGMRNGLIPDQLKEFTPGDGVFFLNIRNCVPMSYLFLDAGNWLILLFSN